MEEKNKEGLTWVEWWKAANQFGVVYYWSSPVGERAWRAGEDPTEHAAKGSPYLKENRK
jgi:hypothetical protein